MDRATVFAETRPLLFSIAYRMLGSVMDAEDMVQDTYVRWTALPDGGTESPRAYLATAVTRLCINYLNSARVRREVYVGPWLPEPLVGEVESSDQVELAESLAMAFLVLLERLTPTERAVFLLREVFDFDYPDIARIVEKSESNCRQLFTRARKHVQTERTRFPTEPDEARRLVEEFSRAARAGELGGLVSLLASDITLWADGGGKARAVPQPIHGADHVARFVLGALAKFVPTSAATCLAKVNGQPGLLSYVCGRPQAALVFDIADHRIQAVYVIANPDKLRGVPPDPTVQASQDPANRPSL